MKLLFDHNLSPRLATLLLDEYPGSIHVRDVALDRSPDERVWEYAASQGLTIVSKDSDFHQRSLVRGFPPKVIWVRRGNCSTHDIELQLRQKSPQIHAFADDSEAAFLELE